MCPSPVGAERGEPFEIVLENIGSGFQVALAIGSPKVFGRGNISDNSRVPKTAQVAFLTNWLTFPAAPAFGVLHRGPSTGSKALFQAM